MAGAPRSHPRPSSAPGRPHAGVSEETGLQGTEHAGSAPVTRAPGRVPRTCLSGGSVKLPPPLEGALPLPGCPQAAPWWQAGCHSPSPAISVHVPSDGSGTSPGAESAPQNCMPTCPAERCIGADHQQNLTSAEMGATGAGVRKAVPSAPSPDCPPPTILTLGGLPWLCSLRHRP